MLKKVTLCGSTRFEDHFKILTRELAFAGFIVHGLSAYPSDNGGRDWLDDERKEMYDLVYLGKIADSDAIVVIDGIVEEQPYIGDSTHREETWARLNGIPIIRYSRAQYDPTNATIMLVRELFG